MVNYHNELYFEGTSTEVMLVYFGQWKNGKKVVWLLYSIMIINYILEVDHPNKLHSEETSIEVMLI